MSFSLLVCGSVNRLACEWRLACASSIIDIHVSLHDVRTVLCCHCRSHAWQLALLWASLLEPSYEAFVYCVNPSSYISDLFCQCSGQ